MRRVEVVRTYLQLAAPGDLVPVSKPPETPLTFLRHAPSVARYRWLYDEVGRHWHWRDRLAWSDEQVAAHVGSPAVAVWEAHADGDCAGWFELQRHEAHDVEIVYFGLRPAFIGRGFGGAMLTRAAIEAWRMGATRVWLHTCTLDGPAALPNYRARGFREFRTESYTAELPE